MLPPSFGGTVRYSVLAKANHSEYVINGFSNHDPYMWVTQQNKAIDLVVLTNVNTFETATMFATGVQDGKLGILIGTPSANAPTHYGDILTYSLPNSKIGVTISHILFSRPDINANQTTLVPDLVTGFDVDSLEVALDYLAKKK